MTRKINHKLVKGNLRVLALLGILAGALLVTYRQAGASDGPTPSTQPSQSTRPIQSTQPYWHASSLEAQREGQVAFASRPADIQAIMQQMYASDSRYRSFSGLFVDRSPGDQPGSIRIMIQQPATVRTATYNNLTGTGSPRELTAGDPTGTTFYAPGINTSIHEQSGRLAAHLPPLSSVPLSVVAGVGSVTTLDDFSDSAGSSVATMYLHPSELITSPFFTNKTVSVEGSATYENRPVWSLLGRQVPGAPQLGSLGNGWRMLVDKRTGLILRVEYLSDMTVSAYAEFKDVTIDGAGAHDVAAPPSFSVPSNAKHINDGPTFQQAIGTLAP